MIKKIILLFTVLIITAACTADRVFEENKDFSNNTWTIDEETNFSFSIDDNTLYYQVFLNLRHDADYPYRNIYVRYNLTDSSSTIIDKALMNFSLFSAKEGKPYGEGISNIYAYQQVLIDSVLFPYEGNFNIELDQYMRTDSLKSVYSAGIKIIEHPGYAE